MKQTVSSLVETGWAQVFSLLNAATGPRTPQWGSDRGQRILVVAPHPDDEAIGCAGTILKHKSHQDQVWIATITDGRRSRGFGWSPEEMAVERRQEANRCAKILGVDHLEWVNLPEGGWSIEDLMPSLTTLLNEYRPQILYAPSRIDFHPEHHRVAFALASSLSEHYQGHLETQVRIYQIQVPLTPILVNLVVPIKDVIAPVIHALNAYQSQVHNMKSALRMRRYAGRIHGISGEAEEFWCLRIEDYCHLHSADEFPWATSSFRGMRPRPFSDLWCYLKGNHLRKHFLDQNQASTNP